MKSVPVYIFVSMISRVKRLFKQFYCYHRWRLAYTTFSSWTQSGVCFECTKCGKEKWLNLDLPDNGTKHIWHFDGYKDMDTYMFHCTHCGKKFEIEVKG